MKVLRFVNKRAEKEFRALPRPIAEQFLVSLKAVALGDAPMVAIDHLTDSVGKGAVELKINGRPAYRTVYVAKYQDAIWVLSAFTKTTNSVDRQAMKTAKQRYKEMVSIMERMK